ncbi:MAG TPA: GspMb/PilO family protein [Gemmatimonadaceae bacterium]|nr:GspMb/PilO family protein [Gemmatimonadaceae bacterium]
MSTVSTVSTVGAVSVDLGMSRRDRRTLLGGAVSVTLLVAIARGVPALQRWQSDRVTDAQAAAQELATYQQALMSSGAVRDSLAARRARLAEVDSAILSGPSPAAIAALLASSVEDLADENSIKLTALQLRADSAATAGLAQVEVRLTGLTDVTGLAGFLHAIEGGGATLVVRELSVSQPEPVSSALKVETLRIDVLVAGIGAIVRDTGR